LQEENKKRVKLLERAGNQENNEQEEFDWEDEDEHSKGKVWFDFDLKITNAY
jgi:hypothetical protein